MQLRRVTAEDFEICKELYEDEKADMLYYDRKRAAEEESKEAVDLQKNSFSPEDEQQIMEDLEFTRGKFERTSICKYVRMYLFEDDDKNVIGFIKLFKIEGYRWKLAYLCVKETYQTDEVFAQILDDLINEKGIKTIDVCTPYIQEKFLQCGYTQIHSGYFRKKR